MEVCYDCQDKALCAHNMLLYKHKQVPCGIQCNAALFWSGGSSNRQDDAMFKSKLHVACVTMDLRVAGM